MAGRPRKNEDTGKPWVVRDVPEATRRKVRVYAAENDLTMAQAVEQMVDMALGETVYSPHAAGASWRVESRMGAEATRVSEARKALSRYVTTEIDEDLLRELFRILITFRPDAKSLTDVGLISEEKIVRDGR